MPTTKRTKKPTSVNDVAQTVADKSLIDSRAAAVKTAKDAVIEENAAQLTIDRVANSLTKTNLDIQKAINNINELFASEVNNLSTVKEAVELKQEQLEELYGKEVVAKTLSDILLDYNNQKKNMQLSQEEARLLWAKEQEEHAQKVKERDELIAKARKRDEDEFEYNKTLARRNEEEAYRIKAEKRNRDREEQERKIQQNWEAREENLRKMEEIVAANKAKVDNYDTTLKSELDKSVAFIANQLKSAHANEMKIAKIESDAEKKLLETQIANLKAQILSQTTELASLRDSLKNLQSEMKEIAVASLQSQSGQKALDAVQQSIQSQNQKK